MSEGVPPSAQGVPADASGGAGSASGGEGGGPTPLTVGARPTIPPLDPAMDETAAIILADATGEGTVEAGRAVVLAARADPEREIYGLTVDNELVAVYVTQKIPMALEVRTLAVAADRRRQGYGRACLVDALRRAGRRPLVVETDDEGLPFYKAVGFKIVGRRKGPSGTPRYRLGWHAPRPGGAALQSGTTQPRPSP
jgi:ribosomal protein S18 acetylase RimI-like enzyme